MCPYVYFNKSIMLKDNINEPGIYRWINKGKSYVGSSINLRDGFIKYYSSPKEGIS